MTSPDINWHFSICKMPDVRHRAFCISEPCIAAHGYKLPRTLLPFSGPKPVLQAPRVKTHFSGSRLFAQPVRSSSNRNHHSLNRLFCFSHGLTDKALPPQSEWCTSGPVVFLRLRGYLYSLLQHFLSATWNVSTQFRTGNKSEYSLRM